MTDKKINLESKLRQSMPSSGIKLECADPIRELA